jgi:pimeloyl-ACP methyl ester carboxylesterase
VIKITKKAKDRYMTVTCALLRHYHNLMDLQITAWLVVGCLVLLLSWFLAPIPWAWLLLGLRSCFVEVEGIRWHYLTGGCGPVLVALHGFGADADHWLRVAPLLRRHFRIIAPDLVGFGSSDPGEDLSFDIASQAHRLGELLDAIGIDRCVLAGNSMGGWIATFLASEQPERALALWLLAPLGVADCEKGELLESIDRGDESPLKINSLPDFHQRVFRPMFARPPWLPFPLRTYYGRNALKRSDAAQRMFRQVRQAAEPLEATAGRIKAPVLLQWGALDRAVHVSGAKRLAVAFPNVQVKIQEAVGHLPMLEAGDLSARQFLEFTSRLGLRKDAS